MSVKVDRKLYTFDATSKKLGRLASEIAIILMGKNKAAYVPHHDMGDIVEVNNVALLDLSKKKQEQKNYYHYSGYQGGLKTTKLKDLFAKDPADVLRRAVREMMPNNKLRNARVKRLIIK